MKNDVITFHPAFESIGAVVIILTAAAAFCFASQFSGTIVPPASAADDGAARILTFLCSDGAAVALVIFMLIAAVAASVALAAAPVTQRILKGLKEPGLNTGERSNLSDISFFFYSVVFFLSAAVWLTANTELFRLLTGHQIMTDVVSSLSYAVIPFALCMMLRAVLPDMPPAAFSVLASALLLNMVLMTSFFITGIAGLENRLNRPMLNMFTVCLYAVQLVFAALAAYNVMFGKKSRMYTGIRGFTVKALTCAQTLILLSFMVWGLIPGAHPVSLVTVCGLLMLFVAGAAMLCDTVILAAECRNAGKYIYLDAMTNLKNRYAWDMKLNDTSALPDNLTMFIMDVNGLKSVNDTRGHAAGDEMIADAGDALRSVFGENGDIYRIGGDEFAVLAEMTDKEAEEHVAALRSCAETKHSQSYGALAISVGRAVAADIRTGASGFILSAMKDVADRMMYEDKARWYSGRGIERRKMQS